MAQIDSLNNFCFELENEQGQNISVFIPEPTRAAFNAIAPTLGKIYTRISNGENPDVFVVDWRIILKEICGENSDKENAVLGFIDRSLLSAKIALNSGEIIDYSAAFTIENGAKIYKGDLSDEILEKIQGFLLFISALFRYITKSSRAKIKGFFTSQNASDWQNSLLKSQNISQTSDLESGAKIVSL